jgi:ankyrin repeat protein
MSRVALLAGLTLVVLQPFACAGAPLTPAEEQTLRTAYSDGPPATVLANKLGKERNLAAVPILLERQSERLMQEFVAGYGQAPNADGPSPELLSVAILAAGDPQLTHELSAVPVWGQFFGLLRNVKSPALFSALYDPARRILLARHGQHPRPDSGGEVHVLEALVSVYGDDRDAEESIAELLPLLDKQWIGECSGSGLISYLGARRYLPSFARLRALLAQETPASCEYVIAQAFKRFATPESIQGIADIIRSLSDLPPDEFERSSRLTRLSQVIPLLGEIPVEEQVDLGALATSVLGKSMPTNARTKLETAFQEALEENRRARERTADNLCYWIYRRNFDIAHSLVAHGTDVNAPASGRYQVTRAGDLPLGVAITESDAQLTRDRLDFIEFLLNSGARTDVRDSSGATYLHKVAARGEARVAELLLAHGAAVAAVSSEGYTPLHLAARTGSIEVMDLLLKYGARVDGAANAGQGAAAHSGTIQSFAFRTPLSVASSPASVRFLLDHHATLDAQDATGATPLVYAVDAGNLPVVRALVEAGANVKLGWADRMTEHTPIMVAYMHKEHEIETLLYDKGARLNSLVVAKYKVGQALLPPMP